MKNDLKIEHIGIAVEDLEKSIACYTALLGREPYKQEALQSQGVVTSFFSLGTSKLELLSSTQEGSVIHKFLANRGEGIHHIALAVDHLESEILRLKKVGFTFVSETPKVGADNKRIVFMHPKDTSGVLIELCEKIQKEE